MVDFKVTLKFASLALELLFDNPTDAEWNKSYLLTAEKWCYPRLGLELIWWVGTSAELRFAIPKCWWPANSLALLFIIFCFCPFPISFLHSLLLSFHAQSFTCQLYLQNICFFYIFLNNDSLFLIILNLYQYFNYSTHSPSLGYLHHIPITPHLTKRI